MGSMQRTQIALGLGGFGAGETDQGEREADKAQYAQGRPRGSGTSATLAGKNDQGDSESGRRGAG